MNLKFLFLLVVVCICISCDKFSYSKNKDLQVMDSLVDFTSVDFYPSFTECDSLIDKTKNSDCFRNTIHTKIGEELQKYPLTVKDSINEIVYVDVLINADGNIIFKEIMSSEKLKQQLPIFDSILQKSIKNLPKIHPAIKRGIPVTTKYRLPIKVLLKD